MLSDSLGRDLDPKASLHRLGKLAGVPGALFLGELLLQKGPHLLGDGRGVARSGAVGEARKAALLPPVEVAADAGRAAPGVSGDPPDGVLPRWESRSTWARNRTLGLR